LPLPDPYTSNRYTLFDVLSSEKDGAFKDGFLYHLKKKKKGVSLKKKIKEEKNGVQCKVQRN
jgi:hypothetical protein